MALSRAAPAAKPLFVQSDSVFPELATGNVEDRFRNDNFLGNGSSSIVYKCYHKVTNLPYACKMISKTDIAFDVEDVRREVLIMRMLIGQQNVVSLRGIYENSNYVFLIMDFCSRGDLSDFIALQHPLGCSEQLVAHIMVQIMIAIRSCHRVGVMHSDIKLENIMLCESNTNWPLVKLIDFGLSKIIKGEKVTTIVGTACYMAPEVLQQSYGCESDIWSAGCIMYMLFTGKQPFNLEGVNLFPRAARRKQCRVYQKFEEEFPSSEACQSISKSARDMLSKMLVVNPSAQLTADEFFQHPWAVQHMAQPHSK